MIKVIIDKSKETNPLLSRKSAFISFPYNEVIKDWIKELPYRNYNPNTHTWEIQECDLMKFIKRFPNEKFQIHNLYKDETRWTLDKTIPENYNFPITPFKYQKEGIEFGLNHDKFLLADEMGLGKTLQSIYTTDISCTTGKVLVICCSSSLKYNWKDEVKKTILQDGYVLGTRSKIKKRTKEEIFYEGSGKDRLADLENIDNIKQKYIITNKETLRLFSEKKGRSTIYPIAQKINELCKIGKIQGIIIDEFHQGLKDVKAATSKALLKINDVPIKIAMTGTPVINAPLDVYVVLRWLNVIPDKYDFWKFKHDFANLDEWNNPVSYKNIDQLALMLNNVMLRREKKDNIDLPDKLYQDIYIDMSQKQEKLYEVIEQDIIQNINVMTHSEEPLAKLINLRKVTGNPLLLDASLTKEDNTKLTKTKELVEEITSNNSKVVIFSNWTMMTQLLKDELKQYNPAYITGEINPKQRQDEINKFQNDPNCKICILTYGAGGVGITLTAGNYAILYDEPWTSAQRNQAVDRIHRIGQTNKVTIYTLMCKNTIDESINDIVMLKGKMAQYIVNGQVEKLRSKQLILDMLR